MFRPSARFFLGICGAASLTLCLPDTVPAQSTVQRKDAAAFITLGTGGGPVIRRDRSEPANALVINGNIYLFDIGAGTQRRLAEAGINPRQVRAIFLSHMHIDHTGDLAPFLLNRWVLNDFRPLLAQYLFD